MNDNRKQKCLGAIQLLMVLFIIFSGVAGHCQKFSVGVKAGASLTWPAFGDRDDKDTFNGRLKPGLNAAFLISFPLKDRYDLVLEGGASQRGRIVTFNPGNSWKNDLTMQMADMVMLLRRTFHVQLGKNTPAKVFFTIGPEINYWFASSGYFQVEDGKKYKYDVVFDGGEFTNTKAYIVNMQDVNRWLFSLDIGFGMKAPLHRNRYLTTEVRLASGHTFLGNRDSAKLNRIILDMDDTMRVNLKTISISFAYTLDMDVKESRKGKSTIKKRLRR